MKKKIALLLAAVMTLAVPVTSFAGVIGNVGDEYARRNVPKGTLLTPYYNGALQEKSAATSTMNEQGIYSITSAEMLTIAPDTKKAGTPNYFISYGYGNGTQNGRYNLTLNNAHLWYAEDTSNSGQIVVPGSSTSNTTFKKDSRAYDGTDTMGTVGHWQVSSNSAYSQSLPETGNKVTVYDKLFYTAYEKSVTGATSTGSILKDDSNNTFGVYIPADRTVTTNVMSTTPAMYPNYNPATSTLGSANSAAAITGAGYGGVMTVTGAGTLVAADMDIVPTLYSVNNATGKATFTLTWDASNAVTHAGATAVGSINYYDETTGTLKTDAFIAGELATDATIKTKALALGWTETSANVYTKQVDYSFGLLDNDPRNLFNATTNPNGLLATNLTATFPAQIAPVVVAPGQTLLGQVGYFFQPVRNTNGNSSAVAEFSVKVNGAKSANYALTQKATDLVANLPAGSVVPNLYIPKTAVEATASTLSPFTEVLTAASRALWTDVSLTWVENNAPYVFYNPNSVSSGTPTATPAINLPLVYKSTGDNQEIKLYSYFENFVSLGNGNNGSDKLLASGTTGQGTRFYMSNTITARQTSTTGTANIEEVVAGTFGSGFFALDLSPGFKYERAPLTISTPQGIVVNFLGYNDDMSTAYFEAIVSTKTTANGQRYAINGLNITRRGDQYNYTSETAKLTVRSLITGQQMNYTLWDSLTPQIKIASGDARITTATTDVGVFNNYGIDFRYFNTSQSATTAYSGRINVVTPELFFGERAADSWWSDRDTKFVLTDKDGNILDGAKIAKVVVGPFTNVKFVGSQSEFSTDAQIGNGAYYNFNRSFIELNDLKQQVDTSLASMKMQFTINLAANYVGPVYVSVTGSGIHQDDYVAPVQIADIKAPVTIDTVATPVAIGYQTYKVADVTITEADKGVLASGKTFALTVDEFANTANTNTTDITFNPITAANVKMKQSTLAFNKVYLGGNQVSFAISKPSTQNTKAIFTIDGLQVKINRDVPQGGYDLIAGGSAIAYSYADLKATEYEKSAMFPIKGVIFEDYIKVATGGDAKSVAKHVKLTPGSKTAVVDGTEMTMSNAPYIHEAGRLMVPLRAVSMLFDIPETAIQWDPETGIATITIISQVGQRMVTFENGSSIMTIDNSPKTMVDENNVKVTAEIQEESNRMYIPLRQLAEAFGIKVTWNGSEAIFNPTEAELAQ